MESAPPTVLHLYLPVRFALLDHKLLEVLVEQQARGRAHAVVASFDPDTRLVRVELRDVEPLPTWQSAFTVNGAPADAEVVGFRTVSVTRRRSS